MGRVSALCCAEQEVFGQHRNLHVMLLQAGLVIACRGASLFCDASPGGMTTQEAGAVLPARLQWRT